MENQVNVGNQNAQQVGQNAVNQSALTPETPKTNYLMIGGVILVCFLLFGFGGYYLGKQSAVSNDFVKTPQSAENGSVATAVPTQATDECIIERENILSVVTSFETLQKNRDPNGVLALFTAPRLQDEIGDYQNLSGKDADISPRLYNNVSTSFNTQSYKVMQQPVKTTNDSCVVQVEEQRSNYGGPANPQYLPVQAESFALTLRKQSGEWKIDQYQSLNPKIKKGKYSGFLMEYAN